MNLRDCPWLEGTTPALLPDCLCTRLKVGMRGLLRRIKLLLAKRLRLFTPGKENAVAQPDGKDRVKPDAIVREWRR